MSSSEIQRISLSGRKIVLPAGQVELEDWEDDDEKDEKTEEGDENSTAEAMTPISAANSETAVNKEKGMN